MKCWRPFSAISFRWARCSPHPTVRRCASISTRRASVGDIARSATRAHRYGVITDSQVGPLYGLRVAASLGDAPMLSMPAGESHKTRDTWARLTDQMLAAGLSRDSCVVAVGGGV